MFSIFLSTSVPSLEPYQYLPILLVVGWLAVSQATLGSRGDLSQTITCRGSETFKLLSRCIYLITFHPLAKYPGPLAAKITSWYGAYHALRGDLHLNMLQCHERYGCILAKYQLVFLASDVSPGTIVRYGPNRLLVNSLSGLQG